MSKEENVIKYYVLCNKLKTVIRKGWLDWNVNKERLESVAEHVYGVQMLALAMYSEYEYEIDITKILYMLAIHELEEIIIGDLTMFDISREEKERLGHEAIQEVLSSLLEKEQMESLILEFDERKTKEAMFAYMCDKLECDIQCKLYDEENCVDLNNGRCGAKENERVQKLLSEGASWSDMWLSFGRENYPYDENFLSVSKYAQNNSIILQKK